MATAICKAKLDVHVVFTINENEARALDALSGYGDNAFIDAFYEKLGKAYMRDHEAGLREFLKTIRGVVNPALAQVDAARALLKMDGEHS